jgi:hypothetical protein
LVEKFAGQSLEVGLIIEISEAMASLGLDCRDQTRAFLVQALNRGVRFVDRTLLVAAIQHCLAQGRVHQIEPDLTNFLVGVVAPRPLDDRRPVNLERLAAAVAAVIDPRQSRPPACRRVASTIVGFDACALHPPEVPLGLDFPTWTLLNQYAKEWLLPGSGQIEPDSIVALQTNPTFIDSFMVGINSQFLAELRWRALPVDRTITPLRMFWGQVNYATQKREADITPLRDWAAQPAGDLGDLGHQVTKPGDLTGKRDLVIAFKTALFRRYPSTIVYLVKAPEGSEDTLLQQTPLLTHEPTPDGRTNRDFFGPIFHGALDPDLHFFAFDVDPGKLDEYWLVLDEPPSELRFRNDLPDADDGANYAKRKIDTPTRVAISGAELERLGEQ